MVAIKLICPELNCSSHRSTPEELGLIKSSSSHDLLELGVIGLQLSADVN